MILFTLGTLLTGLLAGVIAAAPSAEASAYGYDFWGVHTLKDIPIPSGELFGAIEGDGLDWHTAGGSFVAAGNVCNWHISLVFYDGARKEDNRTRVVNQPTQNNCTAAGAYKLANTPFRAAAPGSVCIELYRDFGEERLAAVCHAIHA